MERMQKQLLLLFLTIFFKMNKQYICLSCCRREKREREKKKQYLYTFYFCSFFLLPLFSGISVTRERFLHAAGGRKASQWCKGICTISKQPGRRGSLTLFDRKIMGTRMKRRRRQQLSIAPRIKIHVFSLLARQVLLLLQYNTTIEATATTMQ